MGKDLSPLQRSLEVALEAAGLRLSERQVAGEREHYVMGRIEGTPVTVYLYEDEAGFEAPDGWHICEAPDYDTCDALQSAFIAQLVAAVRAVRAS